MNQAAALSHAGLFWGSWWVFAGYLRGIRGPIREVVFPRGLFSSGQKMEGSRCVYSPELREKAMLVGSGGLMLE